MIDNPKQAYSHVDVDDIDYEKYPDLAEAEYLHADIKAGDCLYIPYSWLVH